MTADDLYVIGEGHPSNVVKIGRSNNVPSRLATFQTASPRKLRALHVESGAGYLEPRLHQRFAHLRLEGEWFDFRDKDPVTEVRAALEGALLREHYEQQIADLRAHVARLEKDIEIERSIFAKEREMSDLAAYSQAQAQALAAEIQQMAFAAIYGSSRQEIDAQIAEQRERLGLVTAGVA